MGDSGFTQRLATRRDFKTAMERPCSRAGDSAPRPTRCSRTRRPPPTPDWSSWDRGVPGSTCRPRVVGLAGGARHGNHAHRRAGSACQLAESAHRRVGSACRPLAAPGPARCPVDLRRLGPSASSPTTVDVRTQEAIEVLAREFEFKLSCETRPLGLEPHGPGARPTARARSSAVNGGRGPERAGRTAFRPVDGIADFHRIFISIPATRVGGGRSRLTLPPMSSESESLARLGARASEIRVTAGAPSAAAGGAGASSPPRPRPWTRTC